MKKYLLIAFLILVAANISYIKAQSPDISKHPEKNILPFNAPCSDCVEDLSKRSGNMRQFYKLNQDGSKILYYQRSLSDMHYKDQNGYWMTIDYRLKEENNKVFAA